jgi:hypothetical protein
MTAQDRRFILLFAFFLHNFFITFLSSIYSLFCSSLSLASFLLAGLHLKTNVQSQKQTFPSDVISFQQH